MAVDASGRILVFSEDGAIAQSGPLLAANLIDGDVPEGVTLEVDIARAYINSPSTGLVHEIDYADGARVARSLDVEGDASALVETGH